MVLCKKKFQYECNSVQLPISLSSKLEWVQSAVQSAVQLIETILILMIEKWAIKQSCINIEITSLEY